MEKVNIVEILYFGVLCAAVAYMVKKAKEDRMAMAVLSLLFLLVFVFVVHCAPQGWVCAMVGEKALSAVATALLVRFAHVGGQATEKLLFVGLFGLLISIVAFIGFAGEESSQELAKITMALSIGMLLGCLNCWLPAPVRRSLK